MRSCPYDRVLARHRNCGLRGDGGRCAKRNTGCKQGITRQVYATDTGMLIDIAQDVGQLQRLSGMLRDRNIHRRHAGIRAPRAVSTFKIRELIGSLDFNQNSELPCDARQMGKMDEQELDAFDLEEMIQGFTAPRVQDWRKVSGAEIDAAGRNARRWRSRIDGPFRPGSDIHRREVCRMFRETFNPYRPSELDWPALDPETLQRIVSLPIWDIAVQTEGKARLRMAAYAKTLADPDMRNALALNAWEENRHKEILSRMVAAYGIPLAHEAAYRYPKHTEWAYLVTGYSECIDSFFAFGLFEAARRSGLFPLALIDTFEPVMQEECRHILLFANWVAWHRANLSWWGRIRFEAKVLAVWAFLAWERIGLARTLDTDGNERELDNNFTVTGAQSVSTGDIGVRELMMLCLQENDRRFSGYDQRLLRPATMPRLVRFALRFMRRHRNESV